MAGIHNDGQHIQRVVSSTPCTKHQTEVGVPCWSLYLTSIEGLVPAICNSRVRSSGFDGKISPSSLSQAKTKGPYNGRRI